MEDELSAPQALVKALTAYQTIRAELGSHRLNLTDEKILQAQIEEVILTKTILSLEREYRLSSKDIIDFMIDGLGIEIKIKGSKTEIYRQVERYTEHVKVRVLWLITNKAVKLPDFINSKRVYVMQLGGAWL